MRARLGYIIRNYDGIGVTRFLIKKSVWTAPLRRIRLNCFKNAKRWKIKKKFCEELRHPSLSISDKQCQYKLHPTTTPITTTQNWQTLVKKCTYFPMNYSKKFKMNLKSKHTYYEKIRHAKKFFSKAWKKIRHAKN